MAETRALPLQFRGSLALAVRQFPRNRAATIGLVILLAVCLTAAFAPWVAPYDPVQIKLSMKLKPPSFDHLMGTDHFGRDVFSRMLWGGRTSLSVGLLVVGFAFVLGVPLGLSSGYFGGKVDNALMRLVDAFLTFPPLLLAVALVGLLGPDIKNVMLALGLVQAPILARMVRGSTLAVREEVYVTAARALGASPLRIVLSHLLRNMVSPIVVQLTVVFAAAVVSEASLSFLGFGTQPPAPSWGRDMSEARRFLGDAPWMFLAPTSIIAICVLSINFMGDGLRDALDPRAWRTRRSVASETST
ncbi:ABC transporter permease [Reyranella sp.]|uniref:ABC transporter permease n=1 Tax=Reyranella sp. TaxID=1929291 RepID=UPI003D145342